MHTRALFYPGLLVGSLLLTACDRPADTLISGSTMGTRYSIRVTDCPLPRCATNMQQQVDARLDELNSDLSHYEAASAISRFNQYSGTDWVAVPTDLATVANAALELAALTGGAFDPTVGPAVNVWGFGSAGPLAAPASLPDPATIAASLAAIGYRQLAVRVAPPALQKSRGELQLDLSASAKGYAVDQLSLLLEASGINDYLVEIGGEVRVSGQQPTGSRWRIGIEPPESAMAIDYIVVPGDAAVASSGDYRNFYMAGDRRVSHTIDPLTGTPVDHNLAAVSVIAVTAMEADGLATALMVMGAEQGSRFALEHGLAALFFVRTEAGITAQMTPAFTGYLLSD